MTREPPGAAILAEQTADRCAPLEGPRSLDALVARAAKARYVLLGEASHGTHEYYTWRAEITRRLIEEHGFGFVAVEGDWPACQALNRFIRSAPDETRTPAQVLRAFDRWPTWMWANREIAQLAEWMRERNWNAPPGKQVGFYGLDVYSLWESLDAIQRYVEEHLPESAEATREAMRCFEPFGGDEHRYARAAGGMVPRTCEREVLRMLGELRAQHAAQGERAGREEAFDADQNALVAKNAERYYRAMVRGDADSWNVRDRHMHETLERLMAHQGPDARCIVWEHNTHVGDARATDMRAAGMVNVGQLVREAHPDRDVFVVGFGSHAGTVVAGPRWGAPMRVMSVPAAREGSWEDVLHRAGGDRVVLSDHLRTLDAAQEWRGHRAIGVVYDPDMDHWGNYVPTILPARYDAFLFIDRTRALDPLFVPSDFHLVPETYPMGE